MTKPREKISEAPSAEIEDGKKKIRKFKNWGRTPIYSYVTSSFYFLLICPFLTSLFLRGMVKKLNFIRRKNDK